MQQITISHKTILFTIFTLIGLYLVYQLRFILLLWFISFILVTALNPLVEVLESYKIPHILAVTVSFIFAIAVVSLIVAGIVPTFIDQTLYLVKNLDRFFPDIEFLQLDSDIITSQMETVTRSAINVLSIAAGAFSNLFVIFSMFVLSFYMLIERKHLDTHLHHLFNNKQKEQAYKKLITDVESRLGGWVRGEIALMMIVGLMTYIGLIMLGVPFALPLSLLAGLMELIPNIGPTISAVPSVIIGLTVSPGVALGVVVLYLAIQQLENNLIVPQVMRQSVGLNPMITLMALMVGLTLGGVMGAILAVPFFITGDIIVRFVYFNKHRHPHSNSQLPL